MTIVWSWDGHIENGVPRYQVRVDLALGHGVRLPNEFGRGHWPVAQRVGTLAKQRRCDGSWQKADAIGQAVRT
jgi:hypothetical protein